jgi:hypothetical protein
MPMVFRRRGCGRGNRHRRGDGCDHQDHGPHRSPPTKLIVQPLMLLPMHPCHSQARDAADIFGRRQIRTAEVRRHRQGRDREVDVDAQTKAIFQVDWTA